MLIHDCKLFLENSKTQKLKNINIRYKVNTMNIKTLSAAVASALLLTTAPASFADDSSSLDIGRFLITGAMDTTYISSDRMNSNLVTRFAPIFLFQMNEKIHVESQLEIGLDQNGNTVTEMEYADVHYFLNNNTTVSIGKFLLPFGAFSQNIHPSWVNKLPTMPGIYGHESTNIMRPLISVIADTGVNVSNVFHVGSGKIFTDFYVISGPREETVGAGTPINGAGPEVAFEVKKGDNNGKAAYGGRVAYAFLPEWEVGYSYYTGAYNANGNLNYTMTDFDFNWVAAYGGIRGEYMTTTTEGLIQADNSIHNFDRNGWYVQGVWQARQLGIDILNPVELVLRHSKISKIEGGTITTVGVDYWVESSAVVKVAFENTKLDDGNTDQRLFLQLALGF